MESIRITADCECCICKNDYIQDYRLKKGRVLHGFIRQGVNWNNVPTDDIDIKTRTACYYGIPNDSYEKIGRTNE